MTTSTKSGAKPAKTATKPAAANAVKKAPAVKKTLAAKTAQPAAAKKPAGTQLPAEKRRYYVEVAAFYIAERRGFHGGSQLEDWVQAEAEIDRLLREGILKP